LLFKTFLSEKPLGIGMAVLLVSPESWFSSKPRRFGLHYTV